jgi:predicted DNA-binding transcriptional regulator YafY
MRADRLVALLLLLQRRGRVTAAEAADELEVSTRTARRDLEALAMSGVPIYSTAGRGGGWELIGGASTDLTGLSADETRALFLAAGPRATDRPELRSALRKLTAALPEPFQADAEAAGAALKVDPSGWGQIGGEPGRQFGPRFLDQLTDAVIAGRQVRLDYQGRDSARRWRTVHPLGLVTKRNTWYLVAGIDPVADDDPPDAAPSDTEVDVRTYRVGRIRDLEPLDLAVRRPSGFDLEAVWADIVTEVERRRTTTEVTVDIDATMVGPLHYVFGRHHVQMMDQDRAATDRGGSGGRRRAVVQGQDTISVASQLAGFGAAVEVVEAPDEVYERLEDLAAQLFELYGRRNRSSGGGQGGSGVATGTGRSMTSVDAGT